MQSKSDAGVPETNIGKRIKHFQFESSITRKSYKCHIYFPEGYYSSLKKYPVLYMTDAQWCFEFYAETLEWKKIELVLVGVDQGNDLRRLKDFALYGAENYVSFFKDELIEHIASTCRVSGSKSYMGISLGALFGSILLAKEPVGDPFFKNYMLFDGTFNLLSGGYRKAEKMRYDKSKTLDINLFLTSANPGNEKYVDEFFDRYSSRKYNKLNIDRTRYQVHHKGIAAPSFGDTIGKIDIS